MHKKYHSEFLSKEISKEFMYNVWGGLSVESTTTQLICKSDRTPLSCFFNMIFNTMNKGNLKLRPQLAVFLDLMQYA